MPVTPLEIALSDGQKLAVLKRFRAYYSDELRKLDSELMDILTAMAEADFLAAYLGEQPEVVELRKRKAEVEALERKRQYLGRIIDRLDQVIPEQPAVIAAPPNAGLSAGRPGIKRY